MARCHHMLQAAHASRFAWLILCAGATAPGCAPTRQLGAGAAETRMNGHDELAARSADVQRDPLGYLHRVKQRTAKLEQYTLVLTRQERRGLLRTLREPERIQAWWRRVPLSIRFKWLDPDVKYGESTYVEGRHNNQVRFVPRHGLFGLKPGITAVDLQTPVIWGEARYPVTDFGLDRLMDRTLNSVREARGDFAIEYRGLRTLENGQFTHHLWLRFPQSNRSAPVQELFIDARTDLPAMTLIKRDSGELEGAYQYENIDTRVRLTDEDFLLDAESPQRARAPEPAPASRPATAPTSRPATAPARSPASAPASRGSTSEP